MTDYLCSPRLQDILKKQDGTSGTHVGVLMDGGWLSAYDASEMTRTVREMKYNGMRNYFVPWSMLSGKCGRNTTCGEAFSAFFTGTMAGIAKNHGEPVFVTLVLPQRDIWQRDRVQYLKFLDEALAKGAPNVYPALTTLPQVLLAHGRIERPTLVLSVEPDWTEYALVSGDDVKGQTAAAFGYKANPARHRINDYIHNSVADWHVFRAENWVRGFETILNDVLGQGKWKETARAKYVCLSQNDMDNLGRLKINGNRAEPWDAVEDVARMAKKEIDGLRMSAKKQSNKKNPAKSQSQKARYDPSDPFAF